MAAGGTADFALDFCKEYSRHECEGSGGDAGATRLVDPTKCSGLIATSPCVDTPAGKAFPLPEACLYDVDFVELDAGRAD